MRTALILSLVAAGALAVPMAAHAQDVNVATTVNPVVNADVNITQGNNKPLPVSVTVSPEIRQSLSTKRINLSLDNEDGREALKKVLEESGCSYDFDPEFYRINRGGNPAIPGTQGTTMDFPARAITMKLVTAPIPKALDSLCNALGVGWTADKEDDAITIHIVRLQTTVTLSDTMGNILAAQQWMISNMASGIPGAANRGAPLEGAVAGNFGGGGGFAISGGGFGGDGRFFAFGGLPNVRVKVDAKNAPVRDVITDILKQAKLSFVIDPDIPDSQKTSCTLENVNVGLALAAVCESANIGWRAEQTNDGLLIRVSKRYASEGMPNGYPILTTPPQAMPKTDGPLTPKPEPQPIPKPGAAPGAGAPPGTPPPTGVPEAANSF